MNIISLEDEWSIFMTTWEQFVQKMTNMAEEALAKVIVAMDLDPNLTLGGYFCVRVCNDNGFLMGPILIGQVIAPGMELAHLMESCLKEANRLSGWAVLDLEDSSFHDVVVATDQKNCSYIFCMKGMSKHANQTVMLLTAMKVGCLTTEEAINIANISGNTVFMKCLTEIDEPTSQEMTDNSEHQQLDDEWWGGR